MRMQCHTTKAVRTCIFSPLFHGILKGLTFHHDICFQKWAPRRRSAANETFRSVDNNKCLVLHNHNKPKTSLLSDGRVTFQLELWVSKHLEQKYSSRGVKIFRSVFLNWSVVVEGKLEMIWNVDEKSSWWSFSVFFAFCLWSPDFLFIHCCWLMYLRHVLWFGGLVDCVHAVIVSMWLISADRHWYVASWRTRVSKTDD